MLACVPIGTVVWRAYSSWAREKDRKWRQAQIAQLESVRERMKTSIDPEPVLYPKLPEVPVAGLLEPPRYVPLDQR